MRHELSSSTLIKRISNDNEKTFAFFFEEYHARLYYYFLKKTRSLPDAEELTQLTFIKFWEYRHSLKENIDIKIQLYNRAKSVFIDWLRARASSRKAIEHLSVMLPESQDKQREEVIEMRLQQIYESIAAFPKSRKKIFELFHFQGYTYKQIAKTLNISPKTVDNHIYQGMKELRRLLSAIFLIVIKILYF